MKIPPIPTIAPARRINLGLNLFYKKAPKGLKSPMAKADKGTTANVEFEVIESPILWYK